MQCALAVERTGQDMEDDLQTSSEPTWLDPRNDRKTPYTDAELNTLTDDHMTIHANDARRRCAGGSIARCPQASLPRKRVEDSMNATEIEPRATIGNEHIVRAALAEKLTSSLKVVEQHAACGWMERHEAGSTELGRPDCEHA